MKVKLLPGENKKKLRVAVQYYEVISACMSFILRGVFIQIYGAHVGSVYNWADARSGLL